MYVILCGGRRLDWHADHARWLDSLHALYHLQEVIVGSYIVNERGRFIGADTHAKEWARRAGIDTTVMDANWHAHGTSAGPRRNRRMLAYLLRLQETGPIGVLRLPGGSRTADMCRQAERAGVPVLRYEDVATTTGHEGV